MPPISLSNYYDAESWLESVGFKTYPFDEFVAEREKDLGSYFIEFPYFNEIVKPRTTFLFLNRGGGKSANKIMLETLCNRSLRKQDSLLAISYTDFYLLMEQKEITLQHHVESILRCGVPKLYEVVTRHRRGLELIAKLAEEDREYLIWLLVRYSDSLTPLSLKKQLVMISQEHGWSQVVTSKVVSQVMGLATKTVSSFDNSILPKEDLLVETLSTLLEFKNFKEEQNEDIFRLPSQASPLVLMERFSNLTKLLGLKEIFILVDRVDEFASVTAIKQVANMLKPLVLVVPLLEIVVFKFFLPLEIYSELVQDGLREDKFTIYRYKWTPQDLNTLFEYRLAFSCDSHQLQDENGRKSFMRLFEPHVVPLDNTHNTVIDEMIALAKGSPRDLIRIAKAIFDEHTKLPPIQHHISQTTYQQAITRFQ